MPLNTGGFQLQGLRPVIGPTASPVLFNYANGATMAPKSGMEGFAQGITQGANALGDGLTTLANNVNPVAIAQKRVALMQAQNEMMKTQMNQQMYKMFNSSFDNNTNGGSTQPSQAAPTVGTTPDTSTQAAQAPTSGAQAASADSSQASTPTSSASTQRTPLLGLSAASSAVMGDPSDATPAIASSVQAVQPPNTPPPSTSSTPDQNQPEVQTQTPAPALTSSSGQSTNYTPAPGSGEFKTPMGWMHMTMNGPEPSKQYEQWKTNQMNRSMPSTLQVATDPQGNTIGYYSTNEKGDRVLQKGMLPEDVQKAKDSFESNKIVQGYPTVAQNYGTLLNLQKQLDKNGSLNSSEQNEAVKAFSQMANPGQGVTSANYSELVKSGDLQDQGNTLYNRIFGGGGTVMSNEQFGQMLDAAKSRYQSQANAYNTERGVAMNSTKKILGSTPSYLNDIFPDRVSMYGQGMNQKSGPSQGQSGQSQSQSQLAQNIEQQLNAIQSKNPNWSHDQVVQYYSANKGK